MVDVLWLASKRRAFASYKTSHYCSESCCIVAELLITEMEMLGLQSMSALQVCKNCSYYQNILGIVAQYACNNQRSHFDFVFWKLTS